MDNYPQGQAPSKGARMAPKMILSLSSPQDGLEILVRVTPTVKSHRIQTKLLQNFILTFVEINQVTEKVPSTQAKCIIEETQRTPDERANHYNPFNLDSSSYDALIIGCKTAGSTSRGLTPHRCRVISRRIQRTTTGCINTQGASLLPTL